MKKLLFAFMALMAIAFVACEDDDNNSKTTVDFEDVTLNSNGLNVNDSISGSITSGDLAVTCTWTSSAWGTFGSGFFVSNQTDTANAGSTNAFSCVAQSGVNSSSNYAVFYSSTDSIKFSSPVDMESVMLCNNAYAYVSMKNGDSFAKKFEAGDYFYVTLTLYNESNTSLGTKDFYLGDFRDGKSTIVSDWTELDLSTFSGVSYIKFSFSSSDTGSWGINTPQYFCIDNISYYKAE